MEFNSYAMQYYLCILQIELKSKKNVIPPISGLDYLDDLTYYLFSEYSNSRDELYEIGLALSLSTSFAEFKEKLPKTLI